jgi:hypothetical protein
VTSAMSAFAPQMSAFRCKADITIAACLLLRSLLGVKRTCPIAVRTSAFGPKRTSLVAPHMSAFGGKADMIATAPSASQESEPAWIVHIVRLLLRTVGVETSTDYVSLTEMSW